MKKRLLYAFAIFLLAVSVLLVVWQGSFRMGFGQIFLAPALRIWARPALPCRNLLQKLLNSGPGAPSPWSATSGKPAQAWEQRHVGGFCGCPPGSSALVARIADLAACVVVGPGGLAAAPWPTYSDPSRVGVVGVAASIIPKPLQVPQPDDSEL